MTVDPHMLRTLLQTEFYIVVFLTHASVTGKLKFGERERERMEPLFLLPPIKR